MIEKKENLFREYLSDRIITVLFYILLMLIQVIIFPSIGKLAINIHDGKLYVIPLFGLSVAFYCQFIFAKFLSKLFINRFFNKKE